jgi:DNA-binding beta-propeller fold protein YncE
VGARRSLLGASVAAVFAVMVPGALAAPTLYVTLSGEGIAQYTIATTGRPVPKQPPRAGPMVGDTGGIGVLPDGSSAYAASTFAGLGPVVKQDHRLWQYSIAARSGVLRLKQPRSVNSGKGPSRVVVAPNGRSVYAVDVFADTISQFTVQPGTGRLAPKRPAAVRAGENPAGIAITPNGRYVYVANFQSGDIEIYAVNARTGALTRKASVDVDQPVDVALTPNGRSLYTTVLEGVAQFNVNPATGKLTPKAVPVVDVSKPLGLAVSPDGRSAYVGVDGIAQFNIAASGALSPKTPAIVRVPGVQFPGIGHVAVSPNGRHVYATSDQPPDFFSFRAGPGGRLGPGIPPRTRVGAGQGGIGFLPDAPRARFAASSVGATTTFDARSSTNPGGRIAHYTWNFGDGSRRTTRRPVVAHSFRHLGSYRVTLSVTSVAGCGPGKFIYTGQVDCNGRGSRMTAIVTAGPGLG